MNRSLFRCLTALALAGALTGPALAFPELPQEVGGICITALPRGGKLLLGDRELRPGDVLTAEQTARMTFSPVVTEEDRETSLSYLPILEGHVQPQAEMVISLKGKKNKAPIAEDSALETYKNLVNTQALRVSDPEGETLVFTVTRQPRRGLVTIDDEGNCTYTPKKNKVGIDSFTYTAADPQGNVSREATVTVHILKPADASRYADTAGRSCSFAAEWMKNTGIFVGETLGGSPCFRPDEEVSRGEFLSMMVGCLRLPPEEEVSYKGYGDDIPGWLRPYLTAAVRSGLTAGLPDPETFRADEHITEAETALMLQNALDLPVPTLSGDVPTRVQSALEALTDYDLEADRILTRGKAAELLYALHLKKVVEPELFQ